MDYGALPPEVNSGRMYVGAGAGPMLAAAAAWDGLAADLYSTAASYSSAISDVTGVWMGPASTSMAAAAAPYAAWLSATATQAQQTGVQAKAAAAAYEAAFAMTVPPPVVAANRAQLMTLVATNFFGQNLPAIAATETHYAEMWAQDAAAMYGYAAASGGASALTTFDEPPPTTNPAGQAGQAAAVAHAAENAAGTNAQSVPSTLQALALPTSSSGTSTGPGGLAGTGSILQQLLGESGSGAGSGASAGKLGDFMRSLFLVPLKSAYYQMGDYDHFMKLWEGLLPSSAASKGAEAAAGAPGLSGLGGILGGSGPVSAGAAPGAVSAGAGQAGAVGSLSVPRSWAAAAPAASLTSPAPPVTTAAPGDQAKGLLRGIPLTGTGAGQRAAGGAIGQRYGFRHAVMARPLAGG